MSDDTHPGIERVSNFVSLKKSKNLSKLYSEGYLYIQNLIDNRQCKCLIDDLNDLRGVYPYHIEESKSFPGIFRSPFLNSNNFRDLLLNKTIRVPHVDEEKLEKCGDVRAFPIAIHIGFGHADGAG